MALNTAAGTLPRATAVSATEDDTVEGSAHKKKTPNHRSLGVPPPPNSHSASRPVSGKSPKVAPCTTRCSGHLKVPEARAANDSAAP